MGADPGGKSANPSTPEGCLTELKSSPEPGCAFLGIHALKRRKMIATGNKKGKNGDISLMFAHNFSKRQKCHECHVT